MYIYIMDIKDGKYRCKICNKNYSSYKSLWYHNNKFHSTKVVESSTVVVESGTKVVVDNTKKYICKFCKRLFNDKSNKYKHEKICKNKTNDDKFEEFKNSILDILKQNAKIHPKTLQKINKHLINNTTNNTNTNNTNNGTINNGTIVNNTFVKFGNEHLSQLLTKKQMYGIINRCCLSIEESIKTVHFNKDLPEYSNIFITNLRDSTAYIFDGIKFISVSKDEVIGELLQNHKNNIEEFMETAKLPEFKYKRIMKFLEAINDVDEVFVDVNSNNRRFTNYQAYKLNIIKHLIYNNSDSKLLKKLNNLELEEKVLEYPDTESSINN